MSVLLAFIFGFIAALAWALYIRAIQAGHAYRAAIWDVVIVGVGQVALFQLWAEAGHDVWVLLAGAVGGCLGTWWTVRRSRRIDTE